MMVLFEVFLAPGSDASALLSPETAKETGAVVMTIPEAEALGFAGMPADPEGRDRRLIAVRKADAAWLNRTLEASEVVAGFRMFDVE